MKRCSRCILPDTYPHIDFNNNGICSVCNAYDQRWAEYNWAGKKEDLARIFAKAKKKQRKYDCLVPVSGGRDSSYVLYVCTQVYNLKCLAVNFDNGFVSAAAAQNLRAMAHRFGADFVYWKPKWARLKTAYRTFLLKTGDFCPPCTRAITSYTYKLAQHERIPLIVLGCNPITDNNPIEVEVNDQILFKDVMKGEMSRQDFSDFVMFEGRRFLTKRINLPSYLHFDEQKMTETLERALPECGGFSGHMHFDCEMSVVADWLRRRKWQFGKTTQKYAALVREGSITREQALAASEAPHLLEEPPALATFLEKLEISRSELDQTQELTHTTFKHYSRRFVRLVGRLTGLVD